MKKFCENLKEHATKIMNYEIKEMIPLTYEKNKSYKKQNICYICKKEFSTDNKDKKIPKRLEIIAILLVNIEVLLMIFAI